MTATLPVRTGSRVPAPAPRTRDSYIDLLRGFSLGIVVLCHLGFTVVKWTANGPHTTSPFEYVPGLWIITWVLQVLPLFFYIGGHAHLNAWTRHPRGVARFTLTRLRRLLLPAAVLVAAWIAAGLALIAYYPVDVVTRVVTLVLSPLWFIGVYALLVAMLPLSLWLHRRLGLYAVLPFLAGAVAVDLARFTVGGTTGDTIAYANLVFVWGLAHQLGMSHKKLVELPKRTAIALTTTGLATLTVLVAVFQYPGAMVGVPGRAFSNMNPPTLCIVALLAVQAGLVILLRPAAERLLNRRGPQRLVHAMNRYGLPVFLFHTTGAALFLYGLQRLAGATLVDTSADLAWLLTRPLMLAGSGLVTALLVAAVTRRTKRPRHPKPTR